MQCPLLSKGVLRIFTGAKTEGPKAESGVELSERGGNPLPPATGLRSAVSSPSGVRDGAPTAQRFFAIFSTQDGLSRHYGSLNVDYHELLGGNNPVAHFAYATDPVHLARRSLDEVRPLHQFINNSILNAAESLQLVAMDRTLWRMHAAVRSSRLPIDDDDE